MKDEQEMGKLIPQDIEDFSYDLGTINVRNQGAFALYAKTAAALLWEKYIILEDPSIQVLPPKSKVVFYPPERQVN